MNIFLKIGAVLVVAFGVIGVWFSLRPLPLQTTSVPVATSTSTTSTTTSQTPSQPTPPSATDSVVLDSISPASGSVGSVVTLRGSGFTGDNIILFSGNVGARNVRLTSVTNGHQDLAFTIPSSISPDCKPGRMCAMYVRLVLPGVYSVAVENSNGTSNALSFTVLPDSTSTPK